MGNFVLAKREKLNLRIGQFGPTGSGKTLGALRLAYGLTGDWSKVFLIDADNRSSLGYVDDAANGIGQFMFAALDAPFTPQRYLALAKEAAQAGAGCIIFDTLSQEWAGEGGVLETHDNMPGNSYTNWGKVNPPHYELINWITQKAPCHVIVSLRSKIKHEQIEDENGRKKIEILGEGPIARPGTEYEFHLTLALERGTFRATPITKRGSMLPDMRPVEMTTDLGQRLRAWAETGEIVESLDQAKARLKKELSAELPDKYPDGAAIGAAMKACNPPLTFTDPGQFAVIKAQLVALATA